MTDNIRRKKAYYNQHIKILPAMDYARVSTAGKFVSAECKYRGQWNFLSNVDKFCAPEIIHRDALKSVVLISWIDSVC